MLVDPNDPHDVPASTVPFDASRYSFWELHAPPLIWVHDAYTFGGVSRLVHDADRVVIGQIVEVADGAGSGNGPRGTLVTVADDAGKRYSFVLLRGAATVADAAAVRPAGTFAFVLDDGPADPDARRPTTHHCVSFQYCALAVQDGALVAPLAGGGPLERYTGLTSVREVKVLAEAASRG